MSYTFTVEWDSAGDGTFSTDITSYVKECRINRGRRTDLGKMPAGTATLVLKNHDGRFSPDKADSPYFGLLEMYRRVRIKGTVDGNGTYGMFYGFLLDWDNKPRISQQYVTWYLGDRFALWQHMRLNLPLLRKLPVKCALDLAVNRAVGDNECTNPSVETVLTGYSGLQGVTPVRDATMKIEGDYTVFCDCPGANPGEGWRYDATSETGVNQRIIACIWARASETVNLVFRAWDDVGGVRETITISVGTTPTPLNLGGYSWFDVASTVRYFELYTEGASGIMVWSDGLYFVTVEQLDEYLWHDFDAGTAEIELAASYHQPALEIIQAIAESEPRSFFFPYCGDTSYDNRLRFRDKDWRDTATLQASFRDNSLATINYVKDPSFEHFPVGDHWDFIGAEWSRTSGYSKYGGYRLNAIGAGLAAGWRSASQIVADRAVAAEGEIWTASAYFLPTVLTNIDQLCVIIGWYNAGGGLISSHKSSHLLSTQSDYVRLSLTQTAPALTAKVVLGIGFNVEVGGGGAITCNFDGCQLEEKTAITRYCDGAQPGCVWAGTAHESTSSRAAAVPYFDLLYGEHAIDRISEAEVTSQGDFEDENVSATIWELSPTGYIIPKDTTEVFHVFFPQPARDCTLSVNPDGSGDSYPIAASGNDGHIQRWEDGAHPPDANESAVTNLAYFRVGQWKFGTVYYAYRGYVRWDTSGIDDGATILSATLRLKVRVNRSQTEDFAIQVRDCAWGPALAVDDWSGAGAVRGTYSDTADLPPAGEWIEIDIAVAGINKTGYTEFEIMSDDEANPPTGAEYVEFSSYDQDPAVAPQLVVVVQGSVPDSEAFENYGVGAKITIGAAADQDLVIDVMRITGVPLRGSSEESRVVAASANPSVYERTLPYALPLQGTRTPSMETEANRLANRYDGRIRRCSLVLRPKTDAILTQMLRLEIGELVHVENINDDFSTHMDANHWIEGIDHYFKMTPKSFETTFHLEEE